MKLRCSQPRPSAWVVRAQVLDRASVTFKPGPRLSDILKEAGHVSFFWVAPWPFRVSP